MTPEMNRERAINLLNEFGLPLDEERITMIGDFLTIWIGWELRHVQQPATEPDKDWCGPYTVSPATEKTDDAASIWYADGDQMAIVYGNLAYDIGPDEMAARIALALRDVPQGQPVFSLEEVDSLNAYQLAGVMHPFTCICGCDLVATVRGWICCKCEYTQNWAHEWMKNGKWKNLLAARQVPVGPEGKK